MIKFQIIVWLFAMRGEQFDAAAPAKFLMGEALQATRHWSCLASHEERMLVRTAADFVST
ncbi:MAG: hypothetical protein IIA59_07330 [Candidatus Marinimicrobia bacterium]|nr:hypothetical protein [Candidatus Neomarinimicrobiota bacterium]